MPTPQGLSANLPERAERLAAVLSQHKRDMADVIAIAARHPGDRIFQNLGDRARRIIQTIGRIERTPFLTASGYDDLGEWGENGRAPAIRGLLTSARFHDEQAAQAQRVAA